MITICNYEQSLKNFKIPTPYFFCNLFLNITFFPFFYGTPQFQMKCGDHKNRRGCFSREAEQRVLRTVYTECTSEDGNTFQAWSNVCFKEYCHISHEAHAMKDMVVYVLYYWHCGKHIKEHIKLNEVSQFDYIVQMLEFFTCLCVSLAILYFFIDSFSIWNNKLV